MELLTLEHFAGCLNETFRTRLQDVDLEFVLVEARPIPASGPQRARDPFSLLFLNSAAVVFPQQIYRMQHPRLGDLGIFLAPIARNRDGFVYEAVFN